jgi:hypothetical protein
MSRNNSLDNFQPCYGLEKNKRKGIAKHAYLSSKFTFQVGSLGTEAKGNQCAPPRSET